MLAPSPDTWADRALRHPLGRALVGAVVGGATGIVLLLPAGLVALVRFLLGRPVLSPADAAVLGSPALFVAGYALSFAAGGAVYGLLWPWRRTRWSAALGGIATAFPLLLGLGALLLRQGAILVSPGAWIVALALALLVGPILGLQLRDLGQETSQPGWGVRL